MPPEGPFLSACYWTDAPVQRAWRVTRVRSSVLCISMTLSDQFDLKKSVLPVIFPAGSEAVLKQAIQVCWPLTTDPAQSFQTAACNLPHPVYCHTWDKSTHKKHHETASVTHQHISKLEEMIWLFEEDREEVLCRPSGCLVRVGDEHIIVHLTSKVHSYGYI